MFGALKARGFHNASPQKYIIFLKAIFHDDALRIDFDDIDRLHIERRMILITRLLQFPA